MIVQVKDVVQRAQFDAVAQLHVATRAQMATRLALFGDLPASGWQFYLSHAPEVAEAAEAVALENCEVARQMVAEAEAKEDYEARNDVEHIGALALRGTSATLMGKEMGVFDTEELESFLPFLGIQTLTTTAPCAVRGYPLKQTLFVYTLAAGSALAVPPLCACLQDGAQVSARGDAQNSACVNMQDAAQVSVQGDAQNSACVNMQDSMQSGAPLQGHAAPSKQTFTLDKTPSVAATLPLLFRDAADAQPRENYYADSCVARNRGMAECWLVHYGETPVFTLAASAITAQSVYLSAGETVERYRGQGVGGHYIARMANEYAAKGCEVCLVCEAARCGFYERLGFVQSGMLYQYAHTTEQPEEAPLPAEQNSLLYETLRRCKMPSFAAKTLRRGKCFLPRNWVK